MDYNEQIRLRQQMHDRQWRQAEKDYAEQQAAKVGNRLAELAELLRQTDERLARVEKNIRAREARRAYEIRRYRRRTRARSLHGGLCAGGAV
jgi:hypothetical protein